MTSRVGRALLAALALFVAGTVSAETGGWSAGARDGVNWLFTPEGERFYSKGVNITAGFKADDVSRNGTKLKTGIGFYWGNHYTTLDAWRTASNRRLLDWGFNTRGGWSDESRSFDLALTPDIELGRMSKLHWFDPFAPVARERAFSRARELAAPTHRDPKRIGFFSDNEVGWWNSQLFRWYLSDRPGNGGKDRLVELLRKHYHDSWEELTVDFVPVARNSFDELTQAGAELKLRPGGRGIAVVNAFTRLVCEQYYGLMHEAIKAAAPDALVLGDRLPLYYNQDAILALRGKVDVLSTNYNVDVGDGWVAPWYFESLDALAGGTPVLVSEWFFAAKENRSGNRNNGHLLTVADQAARQRGAAAAVKNFARFPNLVGTHWFQLYDEPLGGREDGEDYNFGLLDRFDVPYEGLTAMFSRVNRELNAMHEQARFDDPAPSTRIKRGAGLSLADNALEDWDKRSTRLRGWAVEKPYQPFGDVHLAWTEQGLWILHLAQNHLEPSFLDYQGGFPPSEAYRLDLAVDAGAGERRFLLSLSPERSALWKGEWQIKPKFYRLENGERQPLDAALVDQIVKPLPHIALEAFIPAELLGVERLAPGKPLRLGLDVRGFFREKRMTFPGPARDPFGPDETPSLRTLHLEE